MDQPEPESDANTVEYPAAQNADEKDRIGVVAKGGQPLGLIPCQQMVLVEIRRCAGTYGISGDQSQKQGTAGMSRQAEEGGH